MPSRSRRRPSTRCSLGASISFRSVALAACSALLLAAPIHREGAWWLAGVSLIPLLIATRRARLAGALALAAFAGTLYGMLISLWIPAALQELGSSRASSLAGHFAVSLWAELPVFALLAVTSRATAAWRPGLRSLALAAAVFLAESAISRVWWGVPWGLFGRSQLGAIGVAQLAAAGGVPLISALLVALNALLADGWRGRRWALPLAVSWLALAVSGLPLARWVRPGPEPSEPVQLLLVQPDLPRSERWGDAIQPLNLHRVRAFAARALAAEPPGIDALVLPENLLTTPVDASPELSAALDAWVLELGVPVLTGLVLASDPPARDRYRSAVVWLAPGRGITERIDKQRAIPLLESSRSFPGATVLARLVGGAAAWKKVDEGAASSGFGGPVAVAPLLCYEMLFPAIAAQRRTPESLALVNLADDGWVPGAAASRQLTQLARFRAIEQRLPLVRVAHGGLSAVVDEFGRVVEELPLDRYASQRVALRRLPPPATYERAAILALPALVFSAAATLATKARSRARSRFAARRSGTAP